MSPGAMGAPRSFAGQMPGLTGGAMPTFDPMAPWTFWMQAAEAWQRTWMPDAARPRIAFALTSEMSAAANLSWAHAM